MNRAGFFFFLAEIHTVTSAAERLGAHRREAARIWRLTLIPLAIARRPKIGEGRAIWLTLAVLVQSTKSLISEKTLMH